MRLGVLPSMGTVHANELYALHGGREVKQFGQVYIDGEWITRDDDATRTLIDPTSEEPWATVTAGGGVADVDLAVAAAKRAFASFSQTSVDERIALIDRIIA